jgi:hypothetical protein
MAAKRAPLDASEFAGLNRPLASTNSNRELLEVPEERERPAQDDLLVQYPLQLLHSQVQTLKRLKRERGLVPARLVREFVAKGLAELDS